MNMFRTLMMAVVLFCAVGCTGSSTPTAPTTLSDVGPTYVAPSGTGAATIDGIEYKYVASAEREAQIVDGFPKLKVGQSREQVREAIGLPDTAELTCGKEPDSPLSWCYKYKIKMWTGGPGMKDIMVHVFFDLDGKLEWAVANNIPGLKEVRSPDGSQLPAAVEGTE